jgi:hypothetical protein
VGGDPNLTVSDHDSEGRWQSPVVWTTGPHERHVYVISGVSMSVPTGGIPTYRYERTLKADEPDPPEDWAKSPS